MVFAELCEEAHRRSSSPAVIEGGGVTSWGDVLGGVRATAELLRQAGLRPGDCLAVQIPNSLAAVVSILACIHERLLCLPLDAGLKTAEAESCFQRAGARGVIRLAAESERDVRLPGSVLVPVVTASGAVCRKDGEGGFLLLSSGTSGTPKLVHRTLPQTAAALGIFRGRIPLDASDRILASLPFCHSFGLLFVLLSAVRAGAALCVDAFSPRSTLRGVERERITVLPGSPFMFRLMAQTEFKESPDLQSVRLAVSAGSALPASVSDAFLHAFGVEIAQSYGTTETGPAALGLLHERRHIPGWVGRPYNEVDIRCPRLDTVPPDVSACGAVVVQSPANAAGYFDDSEATARTFTADGVRTGDIGYRNGDGSLFVLGRERPMINVAGKKVAPAEVEACLRAHPSVADVVVAAACGAVGDQIVRATLVTRGALSAGALREYCAARLADYKIPREFVFSERLEGGVMGKARIPEAS